MWRKEKIRGFICWRVQKVGWGALSWPRDAPLPNSSDLIQFTGKNQLFSSIPDASSIFKTPLEQTTPKINIRLSNAQQIPERLSYAPAFYLSPYPLSYCFFSFI